MEKGKVLAFPGMNTAPVDRTDVKVKPAGMSAKGVLRGVFGALVLVIVVLNKPLSWFLNVGFGFYGLAWLFSDSGFHGAVALMALGGAVLVKYILLVFAKNSVKR